MRGINARTGFAAAALIASAAAPHAANAAFYVTSDLNALPNNTAFSPITLTAADAGSNTFTVNAGTPEMATVSFSVANGQGVVTGSAAGEYADPIAGQGMPYQGYYFSTGGAYGNQSNGEVTFAYSTNQSAVALLWGSVDTFNALEFLENGILVGTVSGQDITQDANGGQGYGGSFYTEVISTTPFNEVIALSSLPSFEFAEFEAAPTSSNIPEPGSLAILGAGLFGLTALLRRRAAP